LRRTDPSKYGPGVRNEGGWLIDFRDARRTAVILASGESAGGLDLTPLTGWPVLAVSDGYRLWRDCAAVYAADWRWWNYHQKAVTEAHGKADRWSQDRKACGDFDLRWVQSVERPGLSRRRGIVHRGKVGNSGGQAIGLAFTEYGARRFVLIGFDFCGSHFFGDHPKEMRITSPWDQMAACMSDLAEALALERCQVINCSPVSRLTYWPKKTIAEALAAG
jgi:hypothetical protein